MENTYLICRETRLFVGQEIGYEEGGVTDVDEAILVHIGADGAYRIVRGKQVADEDGGITDIDEPSWLMSPVSALW